MANRPVFSVSLDARLFCRNNIEFQWFGGFALSQKRKCISSLHQSYLALHPGQHILEISSKSENELGVKLSAFNLTAETPMGEFAVEKIYQAGKVFADGGPYTDLLSASSKEARTDSRLKSSGRLIGYALGEERFPVNPPTLFYNWVYIRALHSHRDLVDNVMGYDAFTDIVFNPQKSINCQATVAAIYVSLCKQNLLDMAMKDRDAFARIVYPHAF